MHMRTLWSFSVLFRVRPGGHEGFDAGDEQCAQVLVPRNGLLDAIPELEGLLARANLDLVDILACCRFDLDDPEEEIPEYVRGDGEAALESGEPVISVYIVTSDMTSDAPS